MGNNHKPVVIAIHTVLLESGFVGLDPNTNLVTNSLDVCLSSMFTLSLYYTLPEIETADTVVVKFQSLGKFINVYGSLSCGSGRTHMVLFNEEQLVPFLKESIKCPDGSFEGTKDVFRFWRTIKDNLALPLLIDICEKAGLGLPPCFMRLPTDIKLKIVELLSVVEIAKVSSTCSEIRYLTLNNELWKVKFEQEFGENVKMGEGSWRMAFVKHWMLRRQRVILVTRTNLLNLYERRKRFGIWEWDSSSAVSLWPNFGGNFFGDNELPDYVNRFRFLASMRF